MGATSHEPYRAVAASQLADELHRYAVRASTAGSRLGMHDAFVATVLRELSSPHRLRRLQPRQIASVLRSLVRLGAHPGEEWLADLDFACYCHPGPFDPVSATAVVRYLGELHAATAPSPPSPSPPPSSSHGAATAAWSQRHARAPSRGLTAPAAARSGHRHAAAAAASSSSAGTSGASGPSPASLSAPSPASQPAAFRFPHAVYLRLLQGGVTKYTYEQLVMVLQAFRRLGVVVDDELALEVGRHMAVQLLGMGPGRRAAALRAVLGGGGGGASGAASSGGSGSGDIHTA